MTSYNCCRSEPVFKVKFSVADEIKTYLICDECSKLDFFRKFIIEKVSVYPRIKSIFDDEFDKNDTPAGDD